MQQRCFKFVFPQLGFSYFQFAVLFFSEHILHLGLILLNGLQLLANHTVIKVHVLIKTIFCTRCLHAQQLRQSSSLHVGQDILNKSEANTASG